MGFALTTSGPRFRIAARLDVKMPNLVKGVQLEGLRKLGDPNEFAKRYYHQGADELVIEDVVASLYGRNTLFDLVAAATNEIFVPITVGGGLKSLEDVERILRSGADKVSLNTAAVKDPKLISRVAHHFGSQCVVVSIQAKMLSPNRWEVYTESGREPSGIMVKDWLNEVQDLGAGEIFLTSIDMDGTFKGFDLDLCALASDLLSIPVVVGGGYGQNNHLKALIETANVSGVAVGSALHSNRTTISALRASIEGPRQND